MQLGDDGRRILPFLLDCLLSLCVLLGLVAVFVRYVGLHADSAWTCRLYNFMLV